LLSKQKGKDLQARLLYFEPFINVLILYALCFIFLTARHLLQKFEHVNLLFMLDDGFSHMKSPPSFLLNFFITA